jgi:hypothetical protein
MAAAREGNWLDLAVTPTELFVRGRARSVTKGRPASIRCGQLCFESPFGTHLSNRTAGRPRVTGIRPT